MTSSKEPHAACDEHAGTIQRLERAVAAERQNAAALRKTVEDLRFKMDVLEKGYGKQLADARACAERAAGEAAALRERWAAVDEDTGHALERLAAARAELAAVSAERERWREIASRAGARPPPERPMHAPASFETAGTINDLIAGIGTLRADAAHAASRGGTEEDARNVLTDRADDLAAAEPMLDPALVFTKGRDGDSDSDERR